MFQSMETSKHRKFISARNLKHSEVLPRNNVKLNWTGKRGPKFPVDAGFLYDQSPGTASVPWERIKWTLSVTSFFPKILIS
jgi:hypothetical protein